MELTVKTKTRLGAYSRGLYRITYVNGYVYVGSFINYKNHVLGETYFGSSYVAKYNGWNVGNNSPKNTECNRKHIQTVEVWVLSKDTAPLQGMLESRFIRHQARHLGIADCALVLDKGQNGNFTSSYRRHGKLLNLHCNDASQAGKVAWAKRRAEGSTELQKEAHRVTIKTAQAVKIEKSTRYKVTTPDGILVQGIRSEISAQLGIPVNNLRGLFNGVKGKTSYLGYKSKIKGYKIEVI